MTQEEREEKARKFLRYLRFGQTPPESLVESLRGRSNQSLSEMAESLRYWLSTIR